MQKIYDDLVDILTLVSDDRTTLNLIESGLEAQQSLDVNSVLHVEQVVLKSIEDTLKPLIEYIDKTYLTESSQYKED